MSERKKQLRVPGHALAYEGEAVDIARFAATGFVHLTHERIGRGLCSCSYASPLLPTTAARRRWHLEHKQKVLARLPWNAREAAQ